MSDVWTELLPLAVASAIVPVQWMLTILLLGGDRGRLKATAFLLGFVVVRLAQGALLGYFLLSGKDETPAEGVEASPDVVSWLVLLVGVLLLVTAGRTYWDGVPDEDAPPPKWLTMASTLTPGRAFLLGMGMLLIGAKFWVFTISAVAAISAAELSSGESALAFVGYAVVAVLPLLLMIAATLVVPGRSALLLDRLGAWLTEHNRVIVITVCLVFGVWFLVQAAQDFGIL